MISLRTLRLKLRWRLVGLFLALALLMGIVIMVGMRQALGNAWQYIAQPLVMDYTDRLMQEMGSPPDVAKARALTVRLPLAIHIQGPVVNWQEPADGWRWLNRFDSQQATVNKTNHLCARLGTWGNRNDRPSLSPHATPEDAEQDSQFCRQTTDGHTIVFSLNVAGWQKRPQLIAWLTLACLLGLTALAYALVRKWLRPLGAMAQGVERYATGDFTQAIPIYRPDELGELSTHINRMAVELEHMLEAKRALLLAISHELRSPLTRAKLHTELLPEDDPDTGVAKAALLRDLNQMRDLITDLLESERLNQAHAVLQRSLCDLPQLAQQALNSLADTPGAVTVKLHFAHDLPRLQLDSNRIQLLMRNLLENALRYGQAEPGAAPLRPPELSIERAPQTVLITVRDYGSGLPDAILPRLTDAFYRPSSARSRSDGGVGLGLYLVAQVAKAHGADLQIRNAHPGLAIVVTLPIH